VQLTSTNSSIGLIYALKKIFKINLNLKFFIDIVYFNYSFGYSYSTL